MLLPSAVTRRSVISQGLTRAIAIGLLCCVAPQSSWAQQPFTQQPPTQQLPTYLAPPAIAAPAVPTQPTAPVTTAPVGGGLFAPPPTPTTNGEMLNNQAGQNMFAAPPAGGFEMGQMTPGVRGTTVSIDPNYRATALSGATLQAAPTLAAWGEFTNAQILARVGGEPILAGDLMGIVNKIIEPHKDSMPAEILEQEKTKLIKQLLEQSIESKMVFADAMTKMPKENLPKMQAAVNESFEKNVVKGMFEKYKVDSRAALEQKLLESGTSLDKQQRMYYERSIATQWMRMNIKLIEEVPVADVLAYYKNNQANYEFPARVRWEELMVEFARMPDKQQAYRTIAEWGNLVVGGQSLGEVAKQYSHGATAYKNGQHDWSTPGSLRHAKVDAAIHSLPVGALSPIIEDEQGFHIVRVLERKEAGRIPFEEAQPEIRKQLIESIQKKQEDDYLAKMRERVPVWTVFDGQDGAAAREYQPNQIPKR